MIDPIIFSFELAGIQFAIHWYGVIIAIAVLIGAFIAEHEIVRRGGQEGYVWDLLIWVVPAGIVGARLGYVINDIAGGGKYFLEDPGRIFKITEGGLHIYGAIALGLLTAYYYTKKHSFDLWLLLDAMAPTLLIAQGLGRVANFINQELYGSPTTLPWGISIAAENRIAAYQDLTLFPEATTRFHPTFAYEMIWNLIAAGIIIWLTRRFVEKLKPGAAFYLWMIFEGVGRFWIEYFRPDQPRIQGTGISYSSVVAILLALIGTLLFLARLGKINLPFLKPGPDEYRVRDRKWKEKKAASR